MIFSTLLSTVAFGQAASSNTNRALPGTPLDQGSVNLQFDDGATAANDDGMSSHISIDNAQYQFEATVEAGEDDGHELYEFKFLGADGEHSALHSLAAYLDAALGSSAGLSADTQVMYLTAVNGTSGAAMDSACKLHTKDASLTVNDTTHVFSGLSAVTTLPKIDTRLAPFTGQTAGSIQTDWEACGEYFTLSGLDASGLAKYEAEITLRIDALSNTCAANKGVLSGIQGCKQTAGVISDTVFMTAKFTLTLDSDNVVQELAIAADRKYGVIGDGEFTLSESAKIQLDSTLRRCNSESKTVRKGEVFCMEHELNDPMPRAITWKYPGFEKDKDGAAGVGVTGGSNTGFYLAGSDGYHGAEFASAHNDKSKWAVLVGAETCDDLKMLQGKEVAQTETCRYEPAHLRDADPSTNSGKEKFRMFFWMQVKSSGQIKSTWTLEQRATNRY